MKYRYSGPLSGVTLDNGDEVMLHPGAEVDLPEGQAVAARWGVPAPQQRFAASPVPDTGDTRFVVMSGRAYALRPGETWVRNVVIMGGDTIGQITVAVLLGFLLFGVPSLGAGTPFKDVDPLVFAVPISLAFTLIVSALSAKPSAAHLAACFPDDRK